MTLPVIKDFAIPVSYAGIAVSGVWLLCEASMKVWQLLPNQKFASRYEEIHSCQKKIAQHLDKKAERFSDILINHELSSSIRLVGKMLDERFDITCPFILNTSSREGLIRWNLFLTEILNYADSGNLKGARETSQKIVERFEAALKSTKENQGQ